MTFGLNVLLTFKECARTHDGVKSNGGWHNRGRMILLANPPSTYMGRKGGDGREKINMKI